jgi:conjugal transfer ATP-binding protein TraC
MLFFQKSSSKESSRKQIEIKSVKDGILIMSQNRYCSVFSTSSINFELKSEAEQDSLIETYQSALNGLTSPIQIMIKVRELDLDKYVERFQTKVQNETKEVYRKQINNYTDFVSKLVTKNKILSRQFFVVLPYEAKESVEFNAIKEQLALSADIVARGFLRLGMRITQLNSMEILELFYEMYNPILAKSQPVTNEILKMMQEVDP